MKGHPKHHPSAPTRLQALLPVSLRPPTAFGAPPAPPSPSADPPSGGSGVAEPGPPLPAATLRSSPDPPDGASRLDLGLPGARALIALGVAAALVAVGYLWLARPRPEPVAEVRPSAAAVHPSMPSSTPASVVVHVAGKVRHPGVVTLPAGSRVTDAIKAAGGLRPGAKLGALNLARHVVDGEQIPVGIAGAAAPAAPAGATAGAPGSAPGAQLDLNTATVEQFDQLPGVGPVLAERIIEYRTQHGAFRSVDQLQEVTGIGEKRYADLKDLVRV
jgi:competence protein ComEA